MHVLPLYYSPALPTCIISGISILVKSGNITKDVGKAAGYLQLWEKYPIIFRHLITDVNPVEKLNGKHHNAINCSRGTGNRPN